MYEGTLDLEHTKVETLKGAILTAYRSKSTTFTVANLYYPQPILNVIAQDFNVSYERSSNVAALSQAGYAVGLLLLCPLGDMVPRRPFILFLIFVTATMVSYGIIARKQGECGRAGRQDNLTGGSGSGCA